MTSFKLNVKIFNIIIIISMFFWNTSIKIFGFPILITPILLNCYNLILLLLKPKVCVKKFYLAIKNTPIKYFLLFIIWLFISPFWGNIDNFFTIAIRIIKNVILCILPIYIFTMLNFDKKKEYNQLIKVYYYIYITLLIYGLVNFFAQFYNYEFLLQFHIHISSYTHQISDCVFVHNLSRATSTFSEASFWGTFLFVTSPIIYNCVKYKYKFSKSNKMNYLIYFIILFLMWVNIILCQSPIYILLSVLYLLFYIRKFIFRFFVKYFGVLLLVSVFSILITSIDINNNSNEEFNKFIDRINNILTSIYDINSLIEIDQSLGTRIGAITNSILASRYHPIIGTGYHMSASTLSHQYNNSPVQITPELFKTITNDKLSGGVAPNIFCSYLVYSGFVGIFLLYSFFIITILKIYGINKKFKNSLTWFIKSINSSAILYLLVSFYWLVQVDFVFWFFFGVLNSYILFYRTQKVKALYYTKKLELRAEEDV